MLGFGTLLSYQCVVRSFYIKFQANRPKICKVSKKGYFYHIANSFLATCYCQNNYKCLFYKSEAIWNIPTKFQPNRLKNGDFSQLKPIMIDGWTNGPTPNAHFQCSMLL